MSGWLTDFLTDVLKRVLGALRQAISFILPVRQQCGKVLSWLLSSLLQIYCNRSDKNEYWTENKNGSQKAAPKC